MSQHKVSVPRIAFGGLISALSLVCMLISIVLPMADYTCPALAGVLLITLVLECNRRTALVAYASVAIISLVIIPNKHTTILFIVFLGYYPIIKSLLEQVKSRIVEYILKLLLFNGVIVFSYFIMTKLFNLEATLENLGPVAEYGKLIVLLAANVAFIIYDIALTLLVQIYLNRIKPKLKFIRK